MVKFSLPESIQRILLGVVFGFILGTVLYQSSRVQMVTPNVVQAEDPDPCKYPANGNACADGTTLQNGDCVRADGASCVLGLAGNFGTCMGGVCNPNTFSNSSLSSLPPLPCDPDNLGGNNPCPSSISSASANSSASAAACCNSQGRCVYP